MTMLAALLAAAMAHPPLATAPPIRRDVATAPIACGDFLAQAGNKPPAATFTGCTAHPDWQGKPLRAIYRVSGKNAAAAEAYLVKAVKLPRLRRFCCQWDTPPQSFVDRLGRAMMVTMVSEETRVSTRSNWGSIATFEIVVDVFTEEV